MKHEIDTGDILLQESFPIGENDTAGEVHDRMKEIGACLLYTSDAADERSSVDLGGRRIIKKKSKKKKKKRDSVGVRIDHNARNMEVRVARVAE